MRSVLAMALVTAILPGWIVRAETVPADAMDPLEIIRRSDDLLRRGESFARLTMVIERPDWTRTVVMDAWTQGASNVLTRVLSPKKEKGVTFLKRGREAWQFVPSIDRTIKIPPSMMLQSWMGSDFTNDDVVRADSIVTDYTHEITDEVTEDGFDYWMITSTPKPGAPVVWGKIVFKIRKQNYVPDRADYFDEDGERIKYYQAFDIRPIEDLEVATRFTMYDLTRPGYQTTLQYDNMSFSPEIRKGTFSLRNLKR